MPPFPLPRIILLSFLFLSFSFSLGKTKKEERIYPYGGPSEQEISNLGNPFTQAEFHHLLKTVYCEESACRPFLIPRSQGLQYEGKLIPWKTQSSGAKTWRSAQELPPITNPAKPLANMRIAIDPGHLGGAWAAMEERDNMISQKFRVCEGVSTCIVADLLSQSLRQLGAEVMITRRGSQPATSLRPDTIAQKLALQRGQEVDEALTKEAEQIFLRPAEINARAALLRKFKPDLTICLHFDAGTFISATDRLHLILHGSMMQGELMNEDLRTAFMSKLLGKVHQEELAVSSTLAKVMAEKLKLPAFTYITPSERVKEVKNNPYLWCRNLLANCLYPGPVIYTEPYAMNNEITARRMTLGDYPGIRYFSGVAYRSIYREYADSITEGLRLHYSQSRKKSSPPPSK